MNSKAIFTIVLLCGLSLSAALQNAHFEIATKDDSTTITKTVGKEAAICTFSHSLSPKVLKCATNSEAARILLFSKCNMELALARKQGCSCGQPAPQPAPPQPSQAHVKLLRPLDSTHKQTCHCLQPPSHQSHAYSFKPAPKNTPHPHN